MKTMTLKNYTSEVATNTTISYIETYLADCGVSGVSKEFQNGQPVALTFHLQIGTSNYSVRLPANVDGVQDFLWRDYVRTHTRPRKTKEDFRDQAARTAWKIQQDWVQVQMSLIKLKQADFLQVFMAFLWDGRQSYYDSLKGTGFKSLPERSGQ